MGLGRESRAVAAIDRNGAAIIGPTYPKGAAQDFSQRLTSVFIVWVGARSSRVLFAALLLSFYRSLSLSSPFKEVSSGVTIFLR